MTHLDELRDAALSLCDRAHPCDRSEFDALMAGQSVLRLRFLARILGCLADRHAGAVGALSWLSRAPSGEVRAEAYEALARCSPHALEDVLDDAAALPDPDPWVESCRVRVLGKIASLRPVAMVRALVKPAGAPQQWIQTEVLRALDACAPDQRADVLAEIEAWLGDPSEDVRETALRWCARADLQLPPRTAAVITALAEDRSSLVREAAACALSRHALKDPDRILPSLLRLTADRHHWSVRLAVAQGTRHWQDAAPFEALGVLHRLINDPVRAIRRCAVRRLQRLSREHPAIAMGVITDWHAGRDVSSFVLVTCLRAVSASREPSLAAHANGMLQKLTRRSA